MAPAVRTIRTGRACSATGSDVLILASGPIASVAMAAAEQLGAEGLDVGVASVACIKPLDERLCAGSRAATPG